MRVFWWQGGLHIEPANAEESRKLEQLVNAALELNIMEVHFGAPTSPVTGDLSNKQAVVGVE